MAVATVCLTITIDASAVREAVREVGILYADGAGISERIKDRVARLFEGTNMLETRWIGRGEFEATPSPEMLCVLADLRSAREVP